MTDTAKIIARHGEWPSPISAEIVAAGSGGSTWPRVVGDETWWCSSDPSTATVQLVRALPGGQPTQVLGTGWPVRNRALGYGGNPYLVSTLGQADGAVMVAFTLHGDGRIHRAEVPGLDGDSPESSSTSSLLTPRPLTPPDEPGFVTQYADLILGPDGREVWCIREITQGDGPDAGDPAPRTVRQIVAVPLDGSAAENPDAIRVVARGHHFLSGVRLSPDGKRLAWIGWDHPDMPWDNSELVVAEIENGCATGSRVVLGGNQVSVPQAEWAGPNTLYAMADPQGWWNLHRLELAIDGASVAVECVLPMARECAGAVWRVGPSWFALTAAGVVLRHGVGAAQLSLWDPASGALRDLAAGWTEFGSDLFGSDLFGSGFSEQGRTAEQTRPAIVVTAGSESHGTTVLRVPLPLSADEPIEPPIECTGQSHRDLAPWNPDAQRRIARGVGGREVHYLYYPPTNPAVTGLDGEVPPLLVHIHGGPTNHTSGTPDLEFGLFASRGFAVASIDYGGSTGYGREYRDRLRRQWGIVDVEDSVTVATDLANLGLADSSRTAIRGGSAGGWTSLASLAFTDTFCAGAVYYPISDPLTWSGGATHDFESQYLRSLVGELPADLPHYERVSPLLHAGKIRKPLVMLQGADDFICKPDQAQRIIDTVSAQGLWHRYLVFDGEGHGFRKQSSVAASLRAEAELYSEVMGVTVDLDTTAPTSDHHTSTEGAHRA